MQYCGRDGIWFYDNKTENKFLLKLLKFKKNNFFTLNDASENFHQAALFNDDHQCKSVDFSLISL